jgi:hypothetical protein
VNIQKPWTAQDAEVVREQYGKQTAAVIALALGRPRSAIIGKARRMGLHSANHKGMKGQHNKRKRQPPSAWIRRQAAAFIEWRRDQLFLAREE